MKIDINTIRTNYVHILNYCLRVLLFILFNRTVISMPLILLVTDVFMRIGKPIFTDSLNTFMMFVFVAILVYIYLTASLCGIFKKLNNLNFVYAGGIIILVNILFFYFSGRSTQTDEILVKIPPQEAIRSFYFWVIPIYFLLHRFFDFITKKLIRR